MLKEPGYVKMVFGNSILLFEGLSEIYADGGAEKNKEAGE